MKLSASNIGWDARRDEKMYGALRAAGFSGLEIAPTRLFPDTPYRALLAAGRFAQALKQRYDLSVCSMQSIWFGRGERMFGGEAPRQALFDYTLEAIEFAQTVGCPNLVFGCPKNRATNHPSDRDTAVSFFRALGDRAAQAGTALALEPNPPIYGTNFINRTKEAFELARDVASLGFRVNLDVGAMIENGESVDEAMASLPLINHIHLSEPNLAPIKPRALHRALAEALKAQRYTGHLSIEMKRDADELAIERAIDYAAEVFL